MDDARTLRSRLSDYRHIIPFGFNCGVAKLLQAWELRRVAYPFDWLFTDDLTRLVDLLLADCRGMFDDLTPHPLVNEHGSPSLKNERFDLLFTHHLPSIPGHRQTLERRVARLYDTLDRQEQTALLRLNKWPDEVAIIEEQEIRIRQRWPWVDLLLIDGDQSGHAPAEETLTWLHRSNA